MSNISLQDLVNIEQLQRFQDEFCQITGVRTHCLDRGRDQITKWSGTEEEREEMTPYLTSELAEILLSRIEDGSLEEQAVEEFEGGRLAAVAIKVVGVNVLYWLVLDTREREPREFYQILDFLRDTCETMYNSQTTSFSAEAERTRNFRMETEKNETARTLDTATAIVRLLDNSGPIEQVMQEWLRILARFLKVDTAEVFRLNKYGQTMDVLCEWRDKGLPSFFDKNAGVQSYDFLQIEKPIIISSESMGMECYEEIRNIGMKAVMLFPVLNQEQGGNMVLSLNFRNNRHTWTEDEIEFTTQAVRVMQSILTKRIQKNSLASSYEVLKDILDNVGCSVYVTNPVTGKIVFVNKVLKENFASEWRNGTLKELVEQGMTFRNESGSYEIFYKERERWYDLVYHKITWVDGSNVLLFALYDITDRKLYQRKIEQQAYTDFLTGLYNRMCCERDLAKQIDHAKQSGKTGAIIYLDLDDFKHINDALGHQYGDVLLKSISRSLKSIHGIEDSCYRMGGDEFVIVVSPDAYDDFEVILGNIRNVFSKPWFLKDADYYCTTSIGVVTFPESGDSVPDLIKKADIAMYEAKKGGKNRLATYSEGHSSISGRRLDMEKNMRDASSKGCREFEVYYQPIIDIQGDEEKCVGAEALVRWNSARLGFVAPSEFIPLAEYLGLINPIGNHVLEAACKACKAWNKKGFPDFKVNVNLSVVQLLQNDIVEIVEATLKKTKLNPKNLTLEVTESLAINDMGRMQVILNKIKELGVSLALDDFGTGYSSLNHIREIPIDIIKVDQSFVRGLTEDAYSQSFIKMVGELAETIGVNICVEGIETTSQYKVLQGMKIKYTQGYYFDRPMPQKEFEQKYIAKKEITM